MDVLLLETIAPEADKLLRSSVAVHFSETPNTGADLARQNDIRAIVTRGKGDVSAALIDQCPNLRVISRCGVGLDNVDVSYATAKGIKVVNAPGANADTVAEHTLALMLSLQRQVFATVSAVKAGNWEVRNNYGGDEIRGKTLGILGYGNIGRRVEQLALAFGMKVIHGARPEQQGREHNSSETDVGIPLSDLLRQSDILTVHLPLTPETKGLLSAQALDQLPPGALIINTARGEIMDEAALTQRLQTSQLGGYAADVLSVEPPDPASALLQLPNVLITPHAASLTARTYAHICTLTVRNTLAVLHNAPIDPEFIANELTH